MKYEFEIYAEWSGQYTEVHFASFLFSEFITAIVVNPLERKLARHTSVKCNVFFSQRVLMTGNVQMPNGAFKN